MQPGADAQSAWSWLFDVLRRRPLVLVGACALLAVGLYPGPEMILMRNAAWRNDLSVRHLADEQAFWMTGLLIIVGPAVVLVNTVPTAFDAAWMKFRSACVRRAQWIVVGSAVFAAGAAAIGGSYVLFRKPTTSDEVAQLWHARILLHGRLWLPEDPNPEFFALDNIIDRNRWYSQFPIGGPAAFVLPMLFHAAWLLNPVLAGFTAVNVYRFAKAAYGTGEAVLSSLLCAACPFIFLMSGSYMNHTLVAFLASLALAELPNWNADDHRRRRRAAIVVGVSLGLVVAVRPLDGAIAALVLGGFVLREAVQNRRRQALFITILGGAIPVFLLLISNWLTTGRPFLFGYEVLWGPNHSLGFHSDPAGNPHTFGDGLAYATAYLMQLNWSLFEWPVPGLVIVAAASIAIGSWTRWEVLLSTWIAAQLAAYAAYWHAGVFYGPRYLFTVVPAFLLICARGLVVAERKLPALARRALVAAVGVSALFSWTVPAAPVGAIGGAEGARPLRSAFKVDLEPIIRSLGNTKALVFVTEPASARLTRRLWGIGLSRSDAARVIAAKDNCELLAAVSVEEQRAVHDAETLSRLQQVRDYSPPQGPYRLQAPDAAFRISDRQSLTPACEAEVTRDTRSGAISYGQALLLNEIDSKGRISGPVVFVADLGDHNEALRRRFSDRVWYRVEMPSAGGDRVPRAVPY